MPDVAAVSVSNLVKRYGQIEALRGVSFDVAAGEIFGILGPNGAGKTTTIECILGLRHPDGGAIAIAGVDAQRQPRRVKAMVGAQLQSTALQDKITPREALTLFASFYCNAIKPSELITRFSLGEKADAPFDSLSGGQRQRLALALAFVNDPAVVFLDEPTAGLDPLVRRELHREIRGIRDAGRTVVLSTHYIEEAHALCDRIAIVDRGKVIAVGKPNDLVAASKTPVRIIVRTASMMPADRAKSLPAVVHAAETESTSTWELATTNATQTIAGLVQAAEADGNALVELSIRPPTLEAVYLELTGRVYG